MPPIDPSALTLEQKASLLSGGGFWWTRQVEEAGIPSVVLADGPHGVRRQDPDAADHLGFLASLPATCFPTAGAVAASWDVEVAARLGAAVGREARALGVDVLLGPGVNIKRSPLCGRNFEYFSEDPLVTGVLATAFTQGLQAAGVGASVKHFAANNQETDRMRVSADVDERPLREIYLAAFERVVTEARPATVMAAYNRLNGVPAAQHRWLLTEVLRGEWGFEGVVVSDWGGVLDRVAAVAAGLDLQMPGPGDADNARVVRAVHEGALDEAHVDASARRVIALAERASPAREEALPIAEHHALARELAAECIVLLKNDGDTLPLGRDARVAVIGEFAVKPRFQGGGSSEVNATQVDNPLDAIRALGHVVTHALGFSADDSRDAPALRDEAVRVASAADVAVVFVGLRNETEGVDRRDLDLPADQVELIRAVADAAPRTVVVPANGGVVSLEGWHDDVDAIVACGLLGQAQGGALADMLFGVTNPSGHLAETIPLRLEDTPAHLNFPGEAGHVRYGEGVMVGYRYHETVKRAVRYPFGHGLSYTTFGTDDVSVTPTGDDTATVRVTVTNTGGLPGKHLVQAYVATTAGPVRRPARELRAFTKLALAPGETRTVELPLDRRAFAYYDVDHARWVVAPGAYTVQIGDNAADITAEATVTLTGDTLVTLLSVDSSLGDWLGHPVVGPVVKEHLARFQTPEQRQRAEEDSDMIRVIASIPMRQFLHFPGVPLTVDDLTGLLRDSR